MDRTDLVVVAQSMGFTASLLPDVLPVALLVMVNAMIPDPGETVRDWWANTGALESQEEAARAGGYGPFDVETYFLHDVDTELAAEGERYQRDEADIAFESVCEFTAWPATGYGGRSCSPASRPCSSTRGSGDGPACSRTSSATRCAIRGPPLA